MAQGLHVPHVTSVLYSSEEGSWNNLKRGAGIRLKLLETCLSLSLSKDFLAIVLQRSPPLSVTFGRQIT